MSVSGGWTWCHGLKQALDLDLDMYQARGQDQDHEAGRQEAGRQGKAAGTLGGTHAHREMFCSSFQCNRASVMQACLQPMTAAKTGAPRAEKKAASRCQPVAVPP